MGSRWRVVVSAVTAVVVLSAGASALAAGGSVVVPPAGKVAGKGYAYWLQASWQLAFKSPAPGPRACQTVRTAHGPVAVLFQSFAGGKQKYMCNEPAGRPIYLVGISNECSTLEKPPSYGKTPAQLKSCARAGFKGATGTAAVDGQPVTNYRDLITATPVFTIHLPKNNIAGSKKRIGGSAAYGEGLLLRGLSAGTHTVHTTSLVPKAFNADVTYTLHVN